MSFIVSILRGRGDKIYQWSQGNLYQKLKRNPDHPVPQAGSWLLSSASDYSCFYISAASFECGK